MSTKKMLYALSLSLLLLLPSDLLSSQKTDQKAQSGKISDESERALTAANVLRKEETKTPETSIPEELLAKAQGIAVFPNVIKAAMGIGGTHGKGLLAKRSARGWGTPIFIDISGGSFGFQIGVEAVDLVLVFTNDDGINGILKGKFEIGGEAGATAGPIGRSVKAGVPITFDSPIYSYSRSKGLFAGIALKGNAITIDDSANQKVYGKNLTAENIALKGVVPTPSVVRPFVETLNSFAPGPAGTRVSSKSAGPKVKGTANDVKNEAGEAGHEVKEAGKEVGKTAGHAGKKVGEAAADAADPDRDSDKQK
jgi:lipid-binding SYLF domain-containing protein